jgi:hypothetical protein
MMKRALLPLAALLLWTGTMNAQQNNRNQNRPDYGNQNRPDHSSRPNPDAQYGRPCNGNCLCGGRPVNTRFAMSDMDFADALTEINKQAFDKDKLRMAIFISSNNYLSSDQIAAISKRFSFEDGKVDLLKSAYANCVDKGMYFKAINTLTFSANKDKVWDYVNANNPNR